MSRVKCNLCTKFFKNIPSLVVHRRRYHSKKLRIFICKPCKYATLGSFSTHHNSMAHRNCMIANKIKLDAYNYVDTFNYVFENESFPHKRSCRYLIQLLEEKSYDFSFTDMIDTGVSSAKGKQSISEHKVRKSRERKLKKNCKKNWIYICKPCKYATQTSLKLKMHKNLPCHYNKLSELHLHGVEFVKKFKNPIYDRYQCKYNKQKEISFKNLKSDDLIKLMENDGYDFTIKISKQDVTKSIGSRYSLKQFLKESKIKSHKKSSSVNMKANEVVDECSTKNKIMNVNQKKFERIEMQIKRLEQLRDEKMKAEMMNMYLDRRCTV